MANVTPGYTWASGNTVTATLLNQAVDDAAVTNIVNADIDNNAAIALSKLATGALPTAITVASANIVDGTIVEGDIANASITPSKLSQPYTLATAQNSTSGTAIDFTGIPSWAKRITVMFSEVSTNGSSNPIIQLGDSGGIETSGYVGATGYAGTNSGATSYSSGFFINIGVAASTGTSGIATLVNVSGNQWAFGLSAGYTNGAFGLCGGGNKTLSATLDRVRITTVNGTDTFDAGTINISYEG